MINNSRTLMMAACATAALTLYTQTSQAAIIDIYTGVGAGETRADWEGAVGSFAEENFNDGVANDFGIAFIGSGHNSAGISGGILKDRLQGSGRTEFTFNSEITSFGADWDLTPGGQGIGIIIVAGGTQLTLEIPETFAGEFFGFTSDVAFSKIVLKGGTQGGVAETYQADNFVYGGTPAVSVSEPGTLALIGFAGVMGAGFGPMVRRRKRAAA